MHIVAALLATLLSLSSAPLGSAQTIKPHPGMLRYPAVSAKHVAFVYANNLWLVPREGGTAIPVAMPQGSVTQPKFSPDGTKIAFGANYDGNLDIYTLPIGGGIPFRVTYHPAGEQVMQWTRQGKLLFAAGGMHPQPRSTQLWQVAEKGGLPEALPIPYGTNGSISEDGEWLAYTPHSTDRMSWKRYRGGMATDIVLFNLKTKQAKRITDWEGTDTLPMWHGRTVYYLSDQGPEHRLNIWSYDTRTGVRKQVTRFTDFDVRWPSMGPGPDGGGEIAFQSGTDIYLLDLRTGQSRVVQVQVPGARPTLRPRTVNAAGYISGWSLSPSAKRAVVEARGDIWTLPAKEGSPRNLTRTSGVAERDPAWSPDGRWISYFSDATGEYELYITESDGKGETKQLTHDGKLYRYFHRWSPDSKHLAFADNSGTIYILTVETGSVKKVDTDPWAAVGTVNWSHDSRWLVYDKTEERSTMSAIWLYDVEKGERHKLTSGMYSDSAPVFDRKGDFLFFASNRSFRPTYDDMGATWIYRGTQQLFAVPLRKDVKRPWPLKSDEETAKKEEPKKEEPAKDQPKPPSEAATDDGVSGTWTGTVKGPSPVPPEGLPITMVLKLEPDGKVTGSVEAMGQSVPIKEGSYDKATKQLSLTVEWTGGSATITATIQNGTLTGTAALAGLRFTVEAKRSVSAKGEDAKPDDKKPEEATKKVEIEIEGFEGRAIELPVSPGRFGKLGVNDRGALLFVRFGAPGSGEGSGIKLLDLTDDKREEKTVATGANDFDLSADGKKILVMRGASASIQDASAGASGDAVVTAGMTVQIEPREEWKQIFTDAWRIMREFFYDPGMHGVDWQAQRERYAAMLPDCVSREDLNFVIAEMIAELNVGHAGVGGGDTEGGPSVPVGLLGVDFALENGAYRIARIYRGAPWDTDARGPLDGLDVQEGDYLLAVNRVPVDVSKAPWAAFTGTAGRTISITVSENPTMDDKAREVLVRPTSSDGGLRYRDWVERNRKYVEERTGGRVGYVYVPDTGQNGQTELYRQFLMQFSKDALIIDERWNGGGQIPNRFIELLNRPVISYWARRHGNDWVTPSPAHFGPKCMLVNGLSGSGGDAFPAFFRQAGLGKLIGMRTWGGLVGLSGNPSFIDGGSMSVPTFGYFEPNGTWGIEGHGVDPDIEVWDDPSVLVTGADPQLDAAIALMLEELKTKPYVKPAKPAYPIRSGMGIKEEDK
ncbi:MAG: hypothetical protein AMXMBFR61_18670 [Fimbriimonadales bacterium]